MLNFALNHMTLANASYDALLDTAAQCGCVGIEVRNDLSSELFDGLDPAQAGARATDKGLAIFAVAEVKAFNNFSEQTLQQAVACGAKSVSLIPRCDGRETDATVRKNNLDTAIRELQPLLESFALTGLIEPLGFEAASLRYKSEVIDKLEKHGAHGAFKLVHDTFHHFLSGETETFAPYTGIVHISGVVDTTIVPDQMQDAHRVLVSDADRLQNQEQVASLKLDGYDGPVSMEAFAPEVHNFLNPAEYLRDSFQFISSGLAARVA